MIYELQVKVEIKTRHEDFTSPYSMWLHYMNPILNRPCITIVSCKEFEKELDFLKRMISFVQNPDKISKIIKDDMKQRMEYVREVNETESLQKQLDSMVLEVLVDMNE